MGSESLGLAVRYSGGVLCRRALRALRVYTRDLTEATAAPLFVELWQVGAWNVAARPSPDAPFGLLSGSSREGSGRSCRALSVALHLCLHLHICTVTACRSLLSSPGTQGGAAQPFRPPGRAARS